ncbi:MAG: DUF349 domain-containing protein [Bacteroidia bacterium]
MENTNPSSLNHTENSDELKPIATPEAAAEITLTETETAPETPKDRDESNASEVNQPENSLPAESKDAGEITVKIHELIEVADAGIDDLPAVEIVTQEVIADLSEMSEEEKELEEVEEAPDYSTFGKKQLLNLALTAVREKSVGEATRIIKAIKPLFENILEEEFQQAMQKFVEDGGTKDDFEYKWDDSRSQFNDAVKELKQRKTEERSNQEAEKSENLKKKQAILDKIKELTETEETKDSLKKLKELQNEWKNIRNVPKEQTEQLWENYHLLIHKFYDRLGIFNELKDLDRKKNLDHKIELTKKVTELALEPNIKRALIMLKKYQEEWRVIGPVPVESNEEIWNRFKSECDKIYEMIKVFQAEAEKKREENLAAKKELLAKASELSAFTSAKIKEWMEKTTAATQLMEDWKKIGMVPMKYRETLWNEFKTFRNAFFNNKNQFFKVLHAERDKNLKEKTALCEKAETIANNVVDFNRQTDEIKRLQNDWKKTGPVHEKISDAIWKRFRGACDLFFEKKASHYSSQLDEQKKNLEIKNGIIQKLESVLEKEDGPEIINELKAIQEEWNNAGFVPINAKEALQKKYNTVSDKVFQKFKQANEELKAMKEKNHFESLLNSSNGFQKIKQEEKFIQDKIRGLRNDLETWENNLGFFVRVKDDNPMVGQIKEKINHAKNQLSQFELKLKSVRSFLKKEQPKA